MKLTKFWTVDNDGFFHSMGYCPTCRVVYYGKDECECDKKRDDVRA